MSDDANLKIIISRIQQRRGLKQDLPQPLRAGEIGFATDSKQVYIGADTDDAISSTYNKTVTFENTLGASASTLSLSNVQIIKFAVPHNRFPKGSGSFDGVSKTKSWKANSNLVSSAYFTNKDGNSIVRNVFDDVVSGNSYINQNQTSRAFNADDVTVLVNGVKQKGDSSGTGALVNTAYDYNFVTGNASTDDHQLFLRFAPENSDDVAISYYGNSHVNHIISNTTIASNTSLTGFHANMSIPEYRYLDSDLIVVNPDVGTGFIGLHKKHIDVVTEGTGIANTSSISCANVIFVKDPADPSLNSNSEVYSGIGNVTSTVDQANSKITFDTGSENINFVELANASSGHYGYVWTEGRVDASKNSYYHKKLLPISANSVANTFEVSIPSNTWSTGRTVSAVPNSGTITLTGNIDGVRPGDNVSFIGNATLEAGSPYAVGTINSGTGTFTITEAALTSNVSSGLDFINAGQTGTSNIIQVFSEKHGFNNGENSNITSTDVIISGSSNTSQIADSDFTISDQANMTHNTFFIVANSSVNANVTGNFKPDVADLIANDDLSIKPAYLLDLSGESTVSAVMTLVNGKNQWFSLSLKPDTNNELYIVSDDQTQYRLFNDPQDSTNSLGQLGFTDATHATRSNNTVKAKLEVWLSKVLNDEKVNIISDVFINDKFSDNADVQGLETWKVNIDTTNGEIDFDSSDEAGHFAEVINKLYFKTNNPDKRGLVTIKTNIEVLTTQALQSGTSDTFYSQPQQLTIGAGQGIALTDLGTDSSAIDTLFIEYSIVGSALDSSNSAVTRYYNQAGTLFYNANNQSEIDANNVAQGSVLIQDVSTSSFDLDANGNAYYSGSIEFGANIANGTVSISADNNISPPTSNAVMKYVVRKWKS